MFVAVVHVRGVRVGVHDLLMPVRVAVRLGDGSRMVVAVVLVVDVQVLVLTMHQSEELARQVREAGARGFVLKSDADQDLVAARRAQRPTAASSVAMA